MNTPDYRAMTDAELAEHETAINRVQQDRRTIATEAEFAAIHEQRAADSLAAAQKVHDDADAARARQSTGGEA